MYQTGQNIPASGIYRVHYGAHRLPHVVTLLMEQPFPRCCKCDDQVEFEAVMLAPMRRERRGQIILAAGRLGRATAGRPVEQLARAVECAAYANERALLLMTQPGVGLITGLAFVLTMGDVSPFKRGK